jgi:hypothetical protein
LVTGFSTKELIARAILTPRSLIDGSPSLHLGAMPEWTAPG